MKGLFIPEITVEMIRNASLEGIEALMAEGEMYDIEYNTWIPCSERLPEYGEKVLTFDGNTCHVEARIPYIVVEGYELEGNWWVSEDVDHEAGYYHDLRDDAVDAWMPLPEPPKGADDDC